MCTPAGPGAIFGEDVLQLAAAVRARGAHLCDRLSIVDAYGPNPNHPLADRRLISAVRDSLASQAIATVIRVAPTWGARTGWQLFRRLFRLRRIGAIIARHSVRDHAASGARRRVDVSSHAAPRPRQLG